MGDVDQLQNQEEYLAQLEQEKKQAEVERLEKELAEEPLKDPERHQRRRDQVSLSEITTGVNLRSDMPDIHNLALSIRQRGLLQPLLLTPKDDGYLLVAGHRRLAALKQLDKNNDLTVPAEIIEDLSEAEVYELMLLENAQRVELSPLQMARALRLILDMNPELDLADVSKSLGLKPAWVKEKFKLLDLPDEVQQMIEDGDLNFSIAKVLERGQRTGHISKDEVKNIAKDAISGKADLADVRERALPTPAPKTVKAGEEDTSEYRPSRDDFHQHYKVKQSGVLDQKEPEIEKEGRQQVTANTALPNRQIREGDFEDADILAAEPARGMENNRTFPLPEDLNEQLDIHLLGWLLHHHGDQEVLEELEINQHEAYAYAAELEDEERGLLLRRISYHLLTQSGRTLEELVNGEIEVHIEAADNEEEDNQEI